ncbi:HAD family hydrolase [Lactobacillus sp. CBA3605]|uniref:HAD family hydrolase n=1 Tax=Lactobacillus sp. CBA3605 TaxID=2099788 RepID=UPI001319C562|nr:HAD hydrolase family protein [Lactobacillus sp. CBA3605]
MNKLISVDIDETLTQSNGKPSPKTISTIKSLIKLKNTLVLNSGRNLTNVAPFLKYFTPIIHGKHFNRKHGESAYYGQSEN